MPSTRLSALDASFLEVESTTAHMHVGWAATFSPPDDARRPSSEELQGHIAARLGRAPRYRQRLARVPFGLHDPEWADHAAFDPAEHIRASGATDLGGLVADVLSHPLRRDRPLWELWIADQLADGRIGMVGKAHHCMVDGIAAVELSTLLLDAAPHPEHYTPDGWHAAPAPAPLELLGRGLVDRAREQLALALTPWRLLASPRRLLGAPVRALHATRAVGDALSPSPPATPFNQPSSSLRHLATLRRPLDDLRRVKARFGTTVNDVVLAACAGAARTFLLARGHEPMRLKTKVPVNVRDGEAGDLGNRISFMFVGLPCDEPDPLMRLFDVHHQTAARKRGGVPEEGDAVLRAAGYAPPPVQRVLSRLMASPRMFNLVVSNIPGPRIPLWLRGCRLEEAYPVVPLADRHAVSIGMTTVRDDACFGLYADRTTLPDADALARDLDVAVDELLGLL
ncbi:MAG TPA: wax ester/triacylglycerol synthase family O-acyltransferase [Solirubrobacteraceae bacterium]|nr:wax ester/triacylglycerol synthase family O-acyltransferase [Solirubrobacteraceae bacterium]